jgi:hypothetical protein
MLYFVMLKEIVGLQGVHIVFQDRIRQLQVIHIITSHHRIILISL